MANENSISTQPTDSAQGYMEIIQKISDNPTPEGIAMMKTLLDMQERWEDRRARILFDEAKARASSRLKHIKIYKNRAVSYDADKNNKAAGQKEAFRYAALEDIDDIAAPVLEEEKIDVSYKIEPSTIAGWHTVVCWLAHAGHREPYPMPMPLDSTGGKGNAQAMGGTQMYGMRRALCGALNIVVRGLDKDASGEAITNEQAAEIDTMLRGSGLDANKFLKMLKAESVQEIKVKDYDRARNAIDAKLMRDIREKEKTKNG